MSNPDPDSEFTANLDSKSNSNLYTQRKGHESDNYIKFYM